MVIFQLRKCTAAEDSYQIATSVCSRPAGYVTAPPGRLSLPWEKVVWRRRDASLFPRRRRHGGAGTPLSLPCCGRRHRGRWLRRTAHTAQSRVCPALRCVCARYVCVSVCQTRLSTSRVGDRSALLGPESCNGPDRSRRGRPSVIRPPLLRVLIFPSIHIHSSTARARHPCRRRALATC